MEPVMLWSSTTWIMFIGLVSIALITDIIGTRNHELSLKEASWLSVRYIIYAVAFGAHLWYAYGADSGSRFFAGYLMEKALSVDNLMVFTAIFSYFGITSQHQQRNILHWGIAGALVFRAVFVGLGVGALMAFGVFTELLFAMLIAWSAWAMLQGSENARVNYSTQWYVKALKHLWPISTATTERLFIHMKTGYWYMTPAFICLVTIEISDIMFAFDSVPAVIGVTRDPLLVYSAVIFAILGLRALYFVLHALRHVLMHLDIAVAIVLMFIAGKLVLHALWDMDISPAMNIGVVLGVLSVGVVASLCDTEEVIDDSHRPR